MITDIEEQDLAQEWHSRANTFKSTFTYNKNELMQEMANQYVARHFKIYENQDSKLKMAVCFEAILLEAKLRREITFQCGFYWECFFI